MTDDEQRQTINEIAALFGLNLPETVQVQRLSDILARVYEAGQDNPKVRKLNAQVSVRKGAKK